MPGIIRSNSAEVSQRRPVLGFTVRTGGHPYFEVAVAASPDLFHPGNRGRRTPGTFYSTRGAGPLKSERGEAVFMVPPECLARLAGNERLYYAVATFADPSRQAADVRLLAPEVTPFVTVAKSFTGRPARSQVGAGASRHGGSSYGAPGPAAGGEVLEWAGDAAQPGAQPMAPAPAAPANGNGNGTNGNGNGNGASAAPAAPALAYDDGFDPDLWSRPLADDGFVGEEEAMLDPDAIGIDAPVPDEGEVAAAASYAGALSGGVPEYSGATWLEAGKGHFTTASRGVGDIKRIVIHITDGTTLGGATSWFRSDKTNVASHYVVGQKGEIVQMVREKDIAHHARGANKDSIGVEHVASVKYDLWPTAAEYCASAALVVHLCDKYGLPKDRDHIVGHSEVGTSNHAQCPQGRWDWTHFMNLVTTGECVDPPAVSQAQGYHGAPSRVRVPGIARGLDVVEPIYKPGDPAAALQTQAEFQARYNAWEAGVPDTTFFPHSPIVHLFGDFGTAIGRGTGAYIAPDLILTCAHNVVDWDNGKAQPSSIRVVPGQNGEHNKPFGEFTVAAGNWEYHPRYDGGFDHDLAVIRVSKGPPHGRYFDVLENLLVSQESPIIVCGYARIGDRFKQHLDGDAIRELGGNMETAGYNLQTKVGTSGSPVYYVTAYEDHERMQSVQETRLVGVHVSGQDNVLNRCCRLTDEKIQWIRDAHVRLGGTAGTFALSASHDACHKGGTMPVTARSGYGAQSRALAGQVVPAVATIAGTVLTRVLDNTGDVNWELDQMRGMKHVGDNPANASGANPKHAVVPTGGLWMENLATDRITATFEIRFDYDGRSLGNVEILNLTSNDAFGWGLTVKANIMDDATVYVARGTTSPTMAAIKVRLHYRFTRAILSDKIGHIDFRLYGNGTYDRVSRFTQ